MLSLVRWTLTPVVVLGWLLAGGPAIAAVPEVRDDAHLFKPETLKKANNIIREIHDEFKQDLVVETFPTPPGGEEKAKQLRGNTPEAREARDKFFKDWLRQRAEAERIGGVYVLICKSPGHVEVGTGPNTEAKAFTKANRDELKNIIFGHLAKKESDQGLLVGTEYVRDTMKANLKIRQAESRPAHRNPAPFAAPVHDRGTSVLGGLGGLLCIGLIAVLAIWLIFGLIRAFSGGGGGYAGGPGGGYMGGGGFGGGGFMSGLMGGLFGAAAGSWLYDRFLRDGGHSGGDYGAGSATDAGG